jgi:hypothetical protein
MCQLATNQEAGSIPAASTFKGYNMCQENKYGEIIHHDEYGKEYVLDEAGNKRPPIHTSNSTQSGGFTTYDSSEGHCGLCGSLTCRGGCFK